MEQVRSSGALLGLAGLAWLALPTALTGQQTTGFESRAVIARGADSTLVERPPDVPRLHHTHLNSPDPDAAIDWYVDVWPQGERGEVAGYPAFVAAVPVLFSRVEVAPDGAWDFDRDRAYPQSAFWHIGAFGNTTDTFEALEARGHTVLRLARSATDAEGVVRSGLAGEEPRPGGFGYLVGPDGALVEITGGPNTDPSFAHVHLFGERPRCTANWYAEVLGFALPTVRDPETGESTPRERYEPCEGERAPPTWPSLDPAGTVRGPSASIRHGSGTISIYPRQCLGDQCEVDEPLVPSRGQVLDHVAFEVDDIDEWIPWLEQQGVTFLGARSRFGESGENGWRIVIEGPDGLSVELVQPPRGGLPD
jgi:catechol 2,3-dioxygenase-like lactoylglutathione lyase family enzyme